MKSLKFIFALTVLLGMAAAAHADTTKSLTVTIYNNNRALINEVRSMTLPQGKSRVEFLGVPQTVEPQTLRVYSRSAPTKLSVLDMNYEYDLINTKNLLDHYIGKEINIILPDPADANERILRKATLIANNDKPIFRIGNEIYVGPYSSVQLPAMPDGLRAKPALVWLVQNDGPAKHDVEVSYLARSLGWSADYVLKVDRKNKKAGLSGWVTLANKSGMPFKNANLKLVAGDVHEAAPVPVFKTRALVMESAAGANMEEESFFEYHLYSLPRPVDIANNQTKQVSLLQAPSITVSKELVCEYNAFGAVRKPVKPGVNVFLKFKNDKASGLGIPLPKGVVRAYQESSDGSVLLIGEDRMEHTPKGEEVRLAMGESFDVTVERKQLFFQKTSKNTYRLSWQIRVRNSSDEPRTVLLHEFLPGTWKLLKFNHKFKPLHGAGVEFTVDAAPDKDVIITYEATVSNS